MSMAHHLKLVFVPDDSALVGDGHGHFRVCIKDDALAGKATRTPTNPNN